MEIPDPYISGGMSLLEQLDKKMVVVLRDGRTYVGYLRTIDQFANLVLNDTVERLFFEKYYGDILRGVYLIRGENVVIAGEIDEEKEKNTGLVKVSFEEVLMMQRKKAEEKERLNEMKKQILHKRGQLPSTNSDFMDDSY